MKKFCLVLCLILTLSLKVSGDANQYWNETNIDKLKSILLKNYDRLTRPENHHEATNLSISLTVLHMELVETKGVLQTHAWMKMKWTDSKLAWNPLDHDNITSLHASADEIWQPDLTVYNSAEANIVDHFAKTNKIIYSDGSVLWVPTSKFETYCNMDLKMWPFDQQTCDIKLGSWTYNAYQINLLMDSAPVDLTHIQNLEWVVLKGTAVRNVKYYDCCPEPYPDVTFTLIFRRRSPMFKAIAVVPAVVIVIMTLSSFWLPPQAGEKLLLNSVACIMICILLVYFSQLLPILAASSPLIVTFYSHTLYLLCISLIISVIVINMSRNRKRLPLLKSIRAIFLDSIIGRALGGQQADPIVADHHAEEMKESPSSDEHRSSDDHQIIQVPSNAKAQIMQNEWIRLAVVIDRLAFIIYVVVFILMGFLHFI